MGGRNVGCVLTGLEIMEGDLVYMASLSEIPIEYEGHIVSKPPLKGIYDGYGGITLTEDIPCFDLEAGQEYDEEDTKRVFVHPDIFDSLTELETSSGKTFGHCIEEVSNDVLADLEDNKFFKRAEDRGIDDRMVPIGLTVINALKTHSRDVPGDLTNAIIDGFGDSEKANSALDLLKRSHLLELAEAELRRPLVPFNWEPQEVGSKAREAVFEKAAEIASRMNSMDEDLSGSPKI